LIDTVVGTYHIRSDWEYETCQCQIVNYCFGIVCVYIWITSRALMAVVDIRIIFEMHHLVEYISFNLDEHFLDRGDQNVSRIYFLSGI